MLIKLLKYGHWQFGRLLHVMDRAEKKYHDESISLQKFLVANDEKAYGQMYADPNMLRHYLVESRLDFYREVAKKVDSLYHEGKTKASCLDVGCGSGHLLAELRKIGFLGRLVGLDVAVSAGQQVKGHKLDLEFYSGYLSDQPWNREFDLILCTEVLEHCEYPDEIIKDMMKVVKVGGYIVITVPDGRKDNWDGHIHFWSPESFKLFIGGFQKNVVFDYFENTNFCMLQC
jgi:2-polyprenyl-3-methyl-5-hydroxy-6-metoxy-1,4-benzoquinol methylase